MTRIRGCVKLYLHCFFQDKPTSIKMAVIDIVLGFFKVVTFVYDIVTFPIYGMTQQSWKERSKQNLGPVSISKHSFLEQRQYKSDSILSKIITILKLARFFTTYTVREKERQLQNWNYFLLNVVVLIFYLL